MSLSDKDKQNLNKASEEMTAEELTAEQPEDMEVAEPEIETMTLEDLAADVTEDPMTFTATLHFEFSDIFNAIEHIETEPESAEPVEPDEAPESEPDLEPELEPESKLELETESEPEIEPDIEAVSEETEAEPETEVEVTDEPEVEPEPELETESEPADEPAAEDELTAEAPEPADKPRRKLFSGLRGNNKGTKKLVIADIILLVVIIGTIAAGLAVANSIVDKANAANQQKIAEMQENIKEVKLAESLYSMAADKVIDDVAVPTYTLDELYALDLREKTGFTAEDLKVITRKGLVGCEEAFVKAEETYGVNSIFLVSIASLESAHGTMMFRPNNMFGYGRTGFSSKEECIMTVAKGLGTRYLPPGGSLYGGSPTLKGVNKRYAANPQWYYKVGKYMQGYYAELAAEKNGALDKFE